LCPRGGGARPPGFFVGTIGAAFYLIGLPARAAAPRRVVAA
jgi:hypothetical protein